MDTALLTQKFERIGARLKVVDQSRQRVSRSFGALQLDISEDRRGEYFEVRTFATSEPIVEVLDVQPVDRHLLLLIREGNQKSKFLCGHDERHWFVAGIPEAAPVGTVRQAKESLQPREVRRAVARKGVSGRSLNSRKNAAFIRQGEWFFLPKNGYTVSDSIVLKNEPLRRGNGGKPHWAEFCYRNGGENVHVCARHPNGVTDNQYKVLLSDNPNARTWAWRTMRRNPVVFVKGRVRHADHATITLNGWHQVLMNTENESKAMRNVVFLD